MAFTGVDRMASTHTILPFRSSETRKDSAGCDPNPH